MLKLQEILEISEVYILVLEFYLGESTKAKDKEASKNHSHLEAAKTVV